MKHSPFVNILLFGAIFLGIFHSHSLKGWTEAASSEPTSPATVDDTGGSTADTTTEASSGATRTTTVETSSSSSDGPTSDRTASSDDPTSAASDADTSPSPTAPAPTRPPSAVCNGTFTDTDGAFILSIENGDSVCEAYIDGVNNSVVAMTVSIPVAAADNSVLFIISDVWVEEDNSTWLFKYTGGELPRKSISIYSFHSLVSATLSVDDGSAFQVDVSYAIQEMDSMTTSLTNSSGKIEASGNSDDYVNFRHSWLIDAGENNFVYFFIRNLTLNETSGDFLAIGTGSELFAQSPALMLTGQRTDYPIIHVNGTEVYVHLYMKAYDPDFGVELYYDTWLYTPPTLFPRPTLPSTPILDAVFYYDDDSDNYYDVVTNFTKYMEKYANQYCGMDIAKRKPKTDLVLDVIVAQVVETKPCLVVEFYIDILNGSCLGHLTFTEDDYRWLRGNYSKQLNKDFGRDVMSTCPMKLLWILAVAIVLFITFIAVTFAGCKGRESNSKSTYDEEPSPNESEGLCQQTQQTQQTNLNEYATYPPENPSSAPEADLMDGAHPAIGGSGPDTASQNQELHAWSTPEEGDDDAVQREDSKSHPTFLPVRTDLWYTQRKSFHEQAAQQLQFPGNRTSSAWPDDITQTYQDGNGNTEENYGNRNTEENYGNRNTEENYGNRNTEELYGNNDAKSEDLIELIKFDKRRNSREVIGHVNEGFVRDDNLEPNEVPRRNFSSMYDGFDQPEPNQDHLYEDPGRSKDSDSSTQEDGDFLMTNM